jgi:hypothetical protein
MEAFATQVALKLIGSVQNVPKSTWNGGTYGRAELLTGSTGRGVEMAVRPNRNFRFKVLGVQWGVPRPDFIGRITIGGNALDNGLIMRRPCFDHAFCAGV